jgi:hypothetical protein
MCRADARQALCGVRARVRGGVEARFGRGGTPRAGCQFRATPPSEFPAILPGAGPSCGSIVGRSGVLAARRCNRRGRELNVPNDPGPVGIMVGIWSRGRKGEKRQMFQCA